MLFALGPMMMSLLATSGFYSAYLYGHRATKFYWTRYWAMMTVPLLAVLMMIIWVGVNVLYLFVVSMFVGLAFEYVFGRAFHTALKTRLWTYKRYGIDGYTSWLAAPMWGTAGIVFWMLSKVVGL
jgi:uncharacterized membrane protein